MDLAEWLPELDVPEPGRQRRLTVLVRYLLLVPHFVVLFFLAIAALCALVVGWFVALFTRRLPPGIARFLTGFLGYSVRVNAAAMLLVDRYPPFALTQESGYPVRIEVRPDTLNRAAVLFRILLVIPAGVVRGLVAMGWSMASLPIWIVVLVLGRMPRALFDSTAAVLRFGMRCDAYFAMLATAYPKRLFGDAETPSPNGSAQEPPHGEETRRWSPVSATRPLVMSTAGKTLLAIYLAAGLISEVLDFVPGN